MTTQSMENLLRSLTNEQIINLKLGFFECLMDQHTRGSALYSSVYDSISMSKPQIKEVLSFDISINKRTAFITYSISYIRCLSLTYQKVFNMSRGIKEKYKKELDEYIISNDITIGGIIKCKRTAMGKSLASLTKFATSLCMIETERSRNISLRTLDTLDSTFHFCEFDYSLLKRMIINNKCKMKLDNYHKKLSINEHSNIIKMYNKDNIKVATLKNNFLSITEKTEITLGYISCCVGKYPKHFYTIMKGDRKLTKLAILDLVTVFKITPEELEHMFLRELTEQEITEISKRGGE